MKRAIIYGRISTNKQSAESIETQIAECKKWAIENGAEIVEIYDDSGESGRSYNVENRDGFQQIVEDAKNGRMEYALVHKIDRFARSVKDYFGQESELEKYGVKLIVVGMPFLQNADIITKSVHVAMAEQFSVNLSNDVSEKMLTFARKGVYLGSPAPYGYEYKTINGVKTLVPHPEQAQGIKFMYEQYLKGNGYHNISMLAAEHGFLDRNNNPFSHTRIKEILRNKRYNGWYVFGLRKKVNGKVRKQDDPNKIIEIPNAHEKIIDDETFNAVQEKLKAKITRNKTTKRVYPLTGKIHCGLCGRPLVGYAGRSRISNGKLLEYSYYRCTGNRRHLCNLQSTNAQQIENYIYDKIKDYVFNDDFINNMLKEVEKHLTGDLSAFKKLNVQIEKQLTSVNNEIKEATREKLRKRIDEDLFEEIVSDLNAEKQTLEVRLINISKQIEVEKKTTEIKKYIKKLKSNIKKGENDIKITTLQQAVRAIIVSPDKIDVQLNLTQTPPPPNNGGKFFILDNLPNGVPVGSLAKHIKINIESDAAAFSILENEYK